MMSLTFLFQIGVYFVLQLSLSASYKYHFKNLTSLQLESMYKRFLQSSLVIFVFFIFVVFLTHFCCINIQLRKLSQPGMIRRFLVLCMHSQSLTPHAWPPVHSGNPSGTTSFFWPTISLELGSNQQQNNN